MAKLNEGVQAPAFEGKDQKGNTVRLEDFKGKKLILYFYPKDNTPGCTAEACNLRDNFKELKNTEYEIVGVSPDSQKSHQNFIAKYDLPFTLISDEDKEILKAYDAWGEKKMYGKTYEGVLRKTYVIGKEQKILNIFDKVNTRDHTRQILDAMENA